MNPLLRRVANLEKRIAPPDDDGDWLDYSLLTPEEAKWLTDIIDRTPPYDGKMDLTLLTDAELEELERVLKKATPPDKPAPPLNATAPTPRGNSRPAQ